MNPIEKDLLKYLNSQFPATKGHIPLSNKIHDVWLDGFNQAIKVIEIYGNYRDGSAQYLLDKMYQTRDS